MKNDEAALPGRPASTQKRSSVEKLSPAAELHVVLVVEEPAEARIYAYSFGDEIRLLDDLDSRPHLLEEIRDALDGTLEEMRTRRARAVPGDLAA